MYKLITTKIREFKSIKKTIFDKIYILSLIILYILYFIIVFNIYQINSDYIFNLRQFIQIYIALYLMYNFNPYRNIEINKFVKHVIFSAGFFLFLSTPIALYINKFHNDILYRHYTNL